MTKYTCKLKNYGVSALIMLLVRSGSKAQNNEDRTFGIVENVPKFPGGDQALFRFIFETTKYPYDAKLLKPKLCIKAKFALWADERFALSGLP